MMGRSLTQQHLFHIELKGFSIPEVQHFVHQVSFVLTAIPRQDLDLKWMYTWLFLKFCKWNKIQNKIDKIKESKPTSRFRTWDYLWGVITDYIANLEGE